MDPVTVLDVEALVSEFESYLREERMRSRRTTTRYLATMRRFVAFLGERRGDAAFKLEALGRDELVGFLKQASKVKDGSASRASWNLHLSVLRTFYGMLFDSDRIDVSPALRVKRQKKTRPDDRPCPSLDQMIRLIEAVEHSSPPTQRARNLTLFKVFMHCGLRVAEVASLTLDQVDIENFIFVRVHRKGDKLLSVEFNDVVNEALEDYLPKRLRAAVPPTTRALFLSKRGTPLSVRMIQELVKAYAKKAGLPKGVTPHVLRHASATMLSEEGKASLDTIKGVLGHESVTTTELYVHTSPVLRRQAVDAVAKSWRRAEKQHKRKKAGAEPSQEVVV